VNSILPSSFSAGLTFEATATSTAYPAAAGWVFTAMLRGPSAIDLTGTVTGNQHRIAASAAETAAWPPGDYAYTIRAINGPDVAEVEAGYITIKPDMASLQAGSEIRTHAAIILANIEAVLEKRATQDQQRYTINNRELWRTPIADLLLLRNTYRNIVAQEQRKARGQSAFGRSVRVRFVCPT
jgi:hypothetical protein